ncbi:MAG: phosphohydrolase [Bacteroidetes bacterium 46-16]|nr:MAG: phosphohydrolase [Bacteroidetes bacterium 46-16]
MKAKGKIINDPVYGFLRFPEPEIMEIIDHPWFQRLRNIKQMGMAHLVYPGAVHTRFHHSLGACHLMEKALDELKIKGIPFTDEDHLAARIAILLHDIGHGPFSHALEHSLVEGISHETISHLIMKRLNDDLGGLLSGAMSIFNHSYPRRYLHQLVSSQLDVDRMDYLNRDSFYTGVSEGVIGYDRILQMLTVRNGELMVEEKGVHSVEKFIIARRLMYWQVYLHKTVLGAEELLLNILTRAKELAQKGDELFATPALKYFLYNHIPANEFAQDPKHLEHFCRLDDNDIFTSIKVWQEHKDRTLSLLCKMLINRNLYKVILSTDDIDDMIAEKEKEVKDQLGLAPADIRYFVSAGITSNSTYNAEDERIQIAMKNGEIKDISEIDNPVVNQALARPVHKKYLCYFRA